MVSDIKPQPAPAPIASPAPAINALSKLHRELGTLRWMSTVMGDPWDQAIDAVQKRIAEILAASQADKEESS